MKNSKLLVFGLAALLFSCSSEDDSVTDSGTDPGTDPVVEVNSVQLSSDATFGNILTDSDGMSLYFFSKDVKGNSECVDGCVAAWPIFYSSDPTLDNDLPETDFGVITREDGEKQTTYKGWPLYYFASDSGAGDTSGDGVGNNWFIAKPDYSLMYAQIDDTFYMTNSTGRAIYTFANDTANNNSFTNEDFSNDGSWPIIGIDVSVVPSILDIDDFDTIDVFGRTQVTYKSNPLYYFGNDTERGDINGVSGVWPLASVDTPTAPIELSAAKK